MIDKSELKDYKNRGYNKKEIEKGSKENKSKKNPVFIE